MADQTRDIGDPGPLREAIDRGHAGDKAGAPDPSAAPLGTDDEAAGTPNTKGQVARSVNAEVGGRPAGGGENAATPATSATPGGTGSADRGAGFAPWLIAAAVFALIVLAAIVTL